MFRSSIVLADATHMGFASPPKARQPDPPLAPVAAQLLTYLKLSGKKLGLLLNFNVLHMKDGIKRIANNL